MPVGSRDSISTPPTACILCSLNCGLETRVEGGHLVKIRGDKTHPMSQGYTCQKALRLDEGVAVAVEFAHCLGVSVDMPRFVPPDTFDRLIGPVFLDALPGKIRRNVVRMLEFFTTYLQSGETTPSSLDQLVALGARQLPDQRESLRNSLQYWAAQNSYPRPETGQAA